MGSPQFGAVLANCQACKKMIHSDGIILSTSPVQPELSSFFARLDWYTLVFPTIIRLASFLG